MRLPGWLFLLLIGFMVAATAICSFGAFNFAYRFNVDLADSGVQIAGGGFENFLTAQPTSTLTPSPVPPTQTPEPGTTLVPVATEVQPQLLAAPTATIDPLAAYHWDDPSRLNVLVLGIDQRGDEQGPFRTDTMMVVSIDPIRKTVGMLSIPRDLWVPIPGFQPNRINTANALGDANGYPGGGAALAADTVEQNFGVDIDRYIRVNFDVFDAVVNLIAPNGVEVCPTEVIDDPDYPDAGYGTIAVHFDPGCQRLDAVHLLQYARTRATQGGDFDRAARQQEVIKSIFNEVISAGGIANIITQAPALWTELSDAISTNFTLEELFGLANLGLQIPGESIHSGTVNNLYVNLATTSQGEQVLTPNWAAIRFLMDDVFNPQTNLSLAELRERALAENAEIVVYNNTDTVGLAGQVRDWLQAQGVTVVSVGNMPQITNAPTYIQDYSAKLRTAHYLAALLGLEGTAVRTATDGLTSADLMIVIGPDIQDIIAGR